MSAPGPKTTAGPLSPDGERNRHRRAAAPVRRCAFPDQLLFGAGGFSGRAAFLGCCFRGYCGDMRANLLPAAGVGAIMGLLAAHEGSGPGPAVVVGVVGCALVLGMIALKRYFTRGS